MVSHMVNQKQDEGLDQLRPIFSMSEEYFHSFTSCVPFNFSSRLRIMALSSSFSLLSAAANDNPVLDEGLPGEAGLP